MLIKVGGNGIRIPETPRQPEPRRAIPVSEFRVDWDAINRDVEAYQREKQVRHDAAFPLDELGDYPWMQWEQGKEGQ